MKLFKKSRLFLLSAMAFAFTAPQAVLAKGNAFSSMDTDKNGTISLSEMQNAKLKRFVKQDTNGDGKIAPSETKKPAGFAKRIAKQDTNRDGFLSKEEMLNTIKAHYLKLDTNKDGALSQSEMSTSKKKRGTRKNNRNSQS